MKPARAGKGSPPRMRGKACSFVNSFSHVGITPAYAGKSFRPIRPVGIEQDHPRVCGEKQQDRTQNQGHQGSPPRMRGKGDTFSIDQAAIRITPAYAGKSCSSLLSAARCGDHPRVCGEKRSRFKRPQDVKGSPPRMRGKGAMACRRSFMVGITPAYAGKRMNEKKPRMWGRDHPRVCGEKTKKVP